MRLLLVVGLVVLVPGVGASYFTVEDARGDHADFAPEKFDIVSISVGGDERNLTVSMIMAADVEEQRGQHAVGLRGGGFHVHVSCTIGQTTPASDDPQQCTVTDVYQPEGAPAGVVQPFAIMPPTISDDGLTWNVTFNRTTPGIPVDSTTDRVYGQSKFSWWTAAGEPSPGAGGTTEADSFATTEMFVLGPAAAEREQEPQPAPIRHAPGPGLLAGLACLVLARRG